MAKAPTLHFVVIYVEDIKKSYEFFTKTLGFADIPQDGGDSTFRQLEGGEGVTLSLQQVDPRFPHKAGTIEIWLKTDDLAGQHARLSEQGVAASPIISMPFANFFAVRSPDGSAITIQN